MPLHKKIIHHSKKILSQAKEKISNVSGKENSTEKSKPLQLSPFFRGNDECPRALVDISIISSIKIIAIVFGVLLIGQFISEMASILLTFFLALFLSAALFPAVGFLERKKIPRGISIIIVYITVLGVLSFIFSTLLPALITQVITLGDWVLSGMKEIAKGNFMLLPEFMQPYGEKIQIMLHGIDSYIISLEHDTEAQKGLFQILKDNVSKIQNWGGSVTTLLSSIISFAIQIIIVLILTFFILYDREKVKAFFLSFFSPKIQKYAEKKSDQIQEKMSQWIHGQMILFVFMGGITWILLSLLGVEYALTLGFLTGLAEFMPYIGPMIAFFISAPIAFGNGIETGMFVVLFFTILQAIEGNFLVPLVMDKALGVPPIVTIIAMLIGFQFLGVLGAILAVPLASIIGIFVFDIRTAETKKFQPCP